MDKTSFGATFFFMISNVIVFQWIIMPILIAKSCTVMRDSYFKLLKLKKIIIPDETKKEEFVQVSTLQKIIINIEKFQNKKIEYNKHLDCQINVNDLKSMKLLEELKKFLKGSHRCRALHPRGGASHPRRHGLAQPELR